MEKYYASIRLKFENAIPILLYNILNSIVPFFGFSTPYWHMWLLLDYIKDKSYKYVNGKNKCKIESS